MRAITGIWRWRGNPLRRTSDLAEAWLAVATCVLVLLSAPVAGWYAGTSVHTALMAQAHRERARSHLVSATAERFAGGRRADPDPETAADGRARIRVVAHWTVPGGAGAGHGAGRHRVVRRGTVTASRTVVPGARFPLWTNDAGRPVARPLDASTAAAHAVLAGLGGGALAGGVLECLRRLAMWRVRGRRLRAWERAWERAGQDWGRTGAGS